MHPNPVNRLRQGSPPRTRALWTMGHDAFHSRTLASKPFRPQPKQRFDPATFRWIKFSKFQNFHATPFGQP